MRPIFVLFSLFTLTGTCQILNVDSLRRELTNHPQRDTIRVILLNQFAFENHYNTPDTTLKYAVQARSLSQNLNYPRGIAVSLRQTGLALWNQGNLSDALEYFVNALKIADSLNFKQIQADLAGNIGLVYNGLGNYKQAQDFFQTSLKKQRELKNRGREVIMLNNLGDCYYSMKDYSKALETYRESLSLGIPVKFLADINHRNIGNVFEATGDLDSALSHYKISLQLTQANLQDKQIANVKRALASVYFKKGDYKAASILVNDAINVAAKGKYRPQLRDGYALLSEIEQAQGKHELAFDHFKKSIAYRDSVQNLVETSRIASLRLEYEMQKKQMEINELKTATEQKERDIWLKNVLLISAVGLLLLLGFLIFQVIRNNKTLKERNNEISEQRAELMTLNEEITAQGEEVLAQHDVLLEKNKQIEEVNRKMAEVNENLEQLVMQRTQVLTEQNRKLSDYAFFNAHQLRAPLARIMGLVNLLMMKFDDEDAPEILGHLKSSSEELDSMVRSVGRTLDNPDLLSAPDEDETKAKKQA